MRNSKGQFVKGLTPHNKMVETVCIVDGCDRVDMKGYGMCLKHWNKKHYRESRGIFDSDLTKSIKRDESSGKKKYKKHYRTNPLKGKTYEEIYGEERAAIKIAKQSRENSIFWTGGISKKGYGPEFSEKLKYIIRKRDGYKCVECGCPEKEMKTKLSIHHIDENKNNNIENNLISLCKSCHSKVHWAKKDWATYFHNIIQEK